MAKQIVHLGTQVVVHFGVLDEKGNVTRPLTLTPDGQIAGAADERFEVSTLDGDDFQELQTKIEAARLRLAATFCAEPPSPPSGPDTTPAEPPPPAP